MENKYKHYLYTTEWLKSRRASLKEQIQSINKVLKERANKIAQDAIKKIKEQQ